MKEKINYNIIEKEVYGKKGCGFQIGERYLQQHKKVNLVLVKFYNGFVYVERDKKIQIPTDDKVRAYLKELQPKHESVFDINDTLPKPKFVINEHKN